MVVDAQLLLEEMTRRFVCELHPNRVYMFGSRARGLANVGSDFDVLIVIPQSDVRRMDVARTARLAVRDLPCAVYVVVRFEEEFDERATWPTTLEAAVKRNGRMLYG